MASGVGERGFPDFAPRAASKPRVCVVGAACSEWVLRGSHLPIANETMVGSAGASAPGGRGVKQALAAARLGAQVALVSAVGDDAAGKAILATLEQAGVDTTHVRVIPGTPTGRCVVGTVDQAGAQFGDHVRMVWAGASGTLTAEDARHAAATIDSAEVVLIQLEIPAAVASVAAALARASGRAVVVHASPARDVQASLLKQTDVLLVNRTEATQLLRMEGVADAARLAMRLPELGPTTAILTMGPNGSVMSHRGRPKRIPSLDTGSWDGSAAEDAFAGAIAGGWAQVHAARGQQAEEWRLVESATAAASVAASLTRTAPGKTPKFPQADEVVPRLSGVR